jgi:hypothetical protein
MDGSDCWIDANNKCFFAVLDCVLAQPLGCSIPELMVHIEARFTDGMSWDNYGAWHLDHIKPLILFDLTVREHFLKAAHYTNLQPLWAADNISKHAKYEAAE